ncbi:MAG: cytochrome oxidase subunit III [Planctomyces sp.]|nr:cytochrome oxidase subunit III [Planctomyces sp.]
MSHSTTIEVALPFDDAQQQRSAAILGMWIFLATEILFFGGLFVGYAVYRYEYFEAFREGSHEMSVVGGGLMTAVLLIGSLLVAISDHAIEEASADIDQRKLRRRLGGYLGATTLLGVAFLSMEFYEYYELIHKGLFPGPGFDASSFPASVRDTQTIQMYFTLFFCMTGLHALHMVIGISLVGGMAVLLSRSEHPQRYANLLTGIGLYWHFVDVIWIFLYPLFYLVR